MRRRKQSSDTRHRQSGLVAPPLLVDEQEPDQLTGGSDTAATAQYIPQIGSAAGKRPVPRGSCGTLAATTPPTPFARVPEDNGSIPHAGAIRFTIGGRRASTTGTIGDGPHGAAGDASGDFDFYKLSTAKSGQTFVVDINTVAPSVLDSVVAVWDATGNLLALNDDDGLSLDSRLLFTIPRNGDYYVSVAGFPDGLPQDPFDSGSGQGSGSRGAYAVIFGIDADDQDLYGVDLRAGDVIGASVTGSGRGHRGARSPRRQARRLPTGPDRHLSGSTPLPGGGNAVLAHVAAASGRHYLAVTGGIGNYDITLEVYRPGPESIGQQAVQTVFLDFDGAA